MTRWQKFRLVVKVVELRLRFIALMAITALTFAYWDTIWNRIDKWQRPPQEKTVAASHIEFYCPMHPSVVRDEPGSCPICGMPLTKRKKGEKPTLPDGVLARVQLAPFRIQQGRIETTEVSYSPMAETLTTVGSIEFDERRQAHIASKVRGMSRVEKLYVNFTGVGVMKGETLAELYSPELFQAIQELLLARKSAMEAPKLQSTLGRSLAVDPMELTRLSADKLKLWGMTQAQVDAILKDGKSDYKVPIISPISGHVLKKNIVEGQYVPEGQAMFEIADLSQVWVKAQVYEDQIGLVKLGQAIEATVEAYPGETFVGKVAFIQPHLDTNTRTIEVRFDLANPQQKLHPGMFATVTLRTPVSETPIFREKIAASQPATTPASIHRTSYSVEEQKVCPVTDAALGSMGAPIPVEAKGQKFWTCCDACPPKVQTDAAKYLTKVARSATPEVHMAASAAQTICPVTGAKLGSMGDPIAVAIEGRTILTCCAACPPKLKADPKRYLARLAPAPSDGVLSVPELAVIDTGRLKMVYIETEPGIYEGRKVVLGPRSGDRFPVLEGLAPGERVVAQGAFLVDAESRLNPPSRSSGMSTPLETPATPSAPPSGRTAGGAVPHSHH
ncbi:efflux RND transporter periplasmic adaptor subunit [Singulisphaera sp. PoT]|uniref:efflux RND transporter periplasmic adaptor subunit n=1 Tax=Singulisphaera sp. PoT TaxID=3411797 RepID=UPI003BF473E4